MPIDESPFLHTLDTCNKEVRKRLNFSLIGKKNFMKLSKRLKIDEKKNLSANLTARLFFLVILLKRSYVFSSIVLFVIDVVATF